MTPRGLDALLEGIYFENQPGYRTQVLKCYEDTTGGIWGSVASSVGQGKCKCKCCGTRVFKCLTDLGEAKKVFLDNFQQESV